jgi:hypothetical protein
MRMMIVILGIIGVAAVVAVMLRYKRSAVEMVIAVSSLVAAVIGTVYAKRQYDMQQSAAVSLNCEQYVNIVYDKAEMQARADVFEVENPPLTLRDTSLGSLFDIGPDVVKCAVENAGAVPVYELSLTFHIKEFKGNDGLLCPDYNDTDRFVGEYDVTYSEISQLPSQQSAAFVIASTADNCIDILPQPTATVRTPYDAKVHATDVIIVHADQIPWKERPHRRKS